MNLEQHFLNKKGQNIIYNNIKNIKDIKVLELGAGEGALSEVILKTKIKELIAIEIDEKLINNIEDKRYKLEINDIKKIKYKLYKDYVCISAPPYSTLDFITKEYINKFKINYIFLVSEKHLVNFKKFKILDVLSEDCFNPISTKEHLLITNINEIV